MTFDITDFSEGPLRAERDSRGVVTLTLDDPQRFNALGHEMLAALQKAFGGIAKDESVRVVVLAANGKAFCAGHNLKDMAQHPDLAWYQDLFGRCSRVMLAIHKLPVPVIARVQGMATAAGCQLVAQCDLAVASEAASFATSGIHYGLFCATPSVPLVRNVPAKRAMEMLLTGDFIDARTALDQGLVNRVVPAEALDAEVEKLVQSILVTIFCCLPLGIVAIIKANSVQGALARGDVQGAVEASNTAKTLCWVSFGIGLILAFIGFVSAVSGS